MEETPQEVAKHQKKVFIPQESSDFHRNNFVDEFIRVYEDLLKNDRDFFKNLSPFGYFLDSLVFCYVTVALFFLINVLLSQAKGPLIETIFGIILSPILIIIFCVILSYLLYYVPSKIFFGASSFLLMFKATMYAASKFVALILPIVIVTSLIGISKDPDIAALMPLSLVGQAFQLFQGIYFLIVFYVFIRTLMNAIMGTHGLSTKKTIISLTACFAIIFGMLAILSKFLQSQ